MLPKPSLIKFTENKENAGQMQWVGENGQATVQASKPTGLVLSYNDRDLIMNYLNQFSMLLYGAALPEHEISQMFQNTNDLVMKLICLQPGDTRSERSEGGCLSDRQSGWRGGPGCDQSGGWSSGHLGCDQSGADDDVGPKKKRQRCENVEPMPVWKQQQPSFFEISSSLKTKIVDQLFNNLNAAIYHDLPSNALRAQIVDQNVNLNFQLRNLHHA